MDLPCLDTFAHRYTVRKLIDFPVPSRDVTDQTLPGREKFNYSRPGRVWSVTPRLGTGKSITFFTVYEAERAQLFSAGKCFKERYQLSNNALPSI